MSRTPRIVASGRNPARALSHAPVNMHTEPYYELQCMSPRLNKLFVRSAIFGYLGENAIHMDVKKKTALNQ
jgi:hypothetical protein